MNKVEPPVTAVFVMPDFNAFDLSAVLQSFEEVARGTAAEQITLLSTFGGAVASADDILRVQTQSASRCPPPKHLILVGSGFARAKGLGDNAPWIQAVHVRSGSIYTISSAVFWVAALGLLGDAHAAVHWSLIPEFRKRFPRNPCSSKTVDGHGDVLTSVGGLGTLDLMLTVIARKHGNYMAKAVADRLALGDRFTRTAS